MKIVLEETTMSINHTKRDAHDFQKDVVNKGANDLTGKTNADKFVNYMEEKYHQKQMMIEKYRLKNNRLKIEKNKLELRLKDREKAGSIHFIDFHQVRQFSKLQMKILYSYQYMYLLCYKNLKQISSNNRAVMLVLYRVLVGSFKLKIGN